jgi:hypothetical protein
MIGLLLVALLQTAETPPAPAETPAAQETAPAPGTMRCEYNRGTRTRVCIHPDGQVLRCREEPVLGSRFPRQVCLTFRDVQQMDNDTREYLDRQQRIPDNRAG